MRIVVAPKFLDNRSLTGLLTVFAPMGIVVFLSTFANQRKHISQIHQHRDTAGLASKFIDNTGLACSSSYGDSRQLNGNRIFDIIEKSRGL